MRPISLGFIAVLLVSSAIAAPLPRHADVSLDFFPPSKVTAAPVFELSGYVRNYGPDEAENVVVRFNGETVRVIESLAVGAYEGLTVRMPRQAVAGTIRFELTAEGSVDDPNPRNNRISRSIEATLEPRLRFTLSGPVADPGAPAEYTATIQNESLIEAKDVSFTIPLPDGWTFERSLTDELRCEVSGRDLRCSIASMAPQSFLRTAFVLRAAPSLEGTPYTSVPVRITSKYGVAGEAYDNTAYFVTLVYRHLVVTSDGDEGEGTLRDALTQAKDVCGVGTAPCKIVFEGAHQIRLATALPLIDFPIVVDGRNEVELDGSLLATGDGLAISSTGFTIRGLAIKGFPGNGISVTGRGQYGTIEQCFIGNNGLRGVSVDADGQYYGTAVRITDNVISGNRRSGVFVLRGIGVEIKGNRIDMNGATGIFFGPGAIGTVQKNVIASNEGAGIGTDPKAGWIAITGNSIFANGTIGIDFGLDLVTPNNSGNEFRDLTRFPVLTAARYDAATGTTRIEGRVDEQFLASVADVELFASDDPAHEGELFLGRVSLRTNSFAFDYAGDLRGRFITATFTRPNNYYPELPQLRTSEFSEALRVEGDAAAPIDRSQAVPRGADLWLRIPNISSRIPAGAKVYGSATLTELGPAQAEGVVVELTVNAGTIHPGLGSMCVETAGGLRCPVPRFGYLSPVQFVIDTPIDAEVITVRGRVTSETFDPDTTNNVATADVVLTRTADLGLEVFSPPALDPGATAVYKFQITKRSVLDARDVIVIVPKPPSWSLVETRSASWSCADEGTSVVCRTPVVSGATAEPISYVLRAPSDPQGQPASFQFATITSASGLLYAPYAAARYEVYRVLTVTTAADDGAGSLRESITRANAECARNSLRCKVVFADSLVLRPKRPLPAITSTGIVIDARSQTVELNGSEVSNGNGLQIFAEGEASVRGLAINHFPENGIDIRREQGPGDFTSRRVIADNVITANGLRGIAISVKNNIPAVAHIVANTISGNNRSGIFLESGDASRIIGNRIVDNGASGIYLGAAGATFIESNEISSNDAGVVTDRAAAAFNEIRGNSIHDNRQLGIDHGIDGVTYNDDPKRREDLPPFPTVLTATWDAAAGVTRIEGVANRGTFTPGLIEIFENASVDGSGYGEGERTLGEIRIDRGTGEDHFELAVPRDLRGRFITATLSRGFEGYADSWTSEFSLAVEVR